MPLTLFHGDLVDDNDPWCPVCLDLSYENFDEKHSKRREEDSKANHPVVIRELPLPGYTLWWRARSDFQDRAENHACVFCATLLQIIDRFWKRRTSSWPSERARVYELKVYKNGSVEILDMADYPRSPLGLLLFTPSGTTMSHSKYAVSIMQWEIPTDIWHHSGHSPVWGRLPPAAAISPSANSKQALQFLRTQLETCTREHKECNQDSAFLPTRVLDVGGVSSDKHVKLFQPPENTPGKYVALSYCWGDGNALKTTKSNLSDLLQGIDESKLPATILDAVELARHLEVQYLWVDALCILQDDTQDWLHESAQMSAVYTKAFLTVSASSVSSSRSSFLGKSHRKKQVLFELPEASVGDKDHDAAGSSAGPPIIAVRRTTLSGFHQNRFDDIIDPVMCRAWTLQEHVLATRLVSFSTDEVQWTCRTLRACECGLPDNIESPRLENLERGIDSMVKSTDVDLEQDMDEIYLQRMSTCIDFWYKLVETYCRRDLSWMRDKLPALSGVAYEYSRILKAKLSTTTDTSSLRYNAGLWNIGIHKGLLWISGQESTFGTSEEYRAPSWSWASTRMKAHWDEMYVTPQAEILECVCALANPDDPFGQVVRQGTYLRVRATVLETQMRLTSGWGTGYQTAPGRVFLDTDVENVPLSNAVFGERSAVAATDDGAEASGPLPRRTVQRRRGTHSRVMVPDKLEKRASRASDSEPDTGSDDEAENEETPIWAQAYTGKQFTVWLLHVGDHFDKPQFIVLGRPAGDEDVFERIGRLRTDHEAALQLSEQEKRIVTIV